MFRSFYKHLGDRGLGQSSQSQIHHVFRSLCRDPQKFDNSPPGSIGVCCVSNDSGNFGTTLRRSKRGIKIIQAARRHFKLLPLGFIRQRHLVQFARYCSRHIPEHWRS